MKKPMVRLPVTLLTVALIISLLLGLVNAVTKDKIAENLVVKTQESIQAVMPEADRFEHIDYTGSNGVTEVLSAMSGSEALGYVVKITVPGSQDYISLIVGVSMDYKVTGVSIVDQSETAGLGGKADSPEFLSQYIGKEYGITLGGGDNSIDAITAATITSSAVTSGVNYAIEAAKEASGS
ncbi:MAG: FMN-binding protein [Oscillospiraceae bacterium]|jgi:electron transport complex protein RnfG